MENEDRGFRKLAGRTVIAYARMSATVVIAVVCRLCLDCVGLILTDQEPMDTAFWFAHCRKDGACVLAGVAMSLFSLLACSAFAWSCADWITDPEKNSYARKYSFAIVVEAASWIPISVAVGKTNALVEWFMDISGNDMVQALLSSGVATILTIICAVVTHIAMTNCRGVQGSAAFKESGLAGFGKFVLLSTLSVLGWAVAWSNWELVLSVIDAMEPGQSMHSSMLSAGVICAFLIFSTCIYLKYGPEPIIPDPTLQQLCYNHGYSSSIRRALLSYVVYSCVVLIVMCACDPTCGLLIRFAKEIYVSDYTVLDPMALLVLCIIACAVTALSAFASAAISWSMEVDELSSTRLSRSVHSHCANLVTSRRQRFDATLSSVLEKGSDAQLVETLQGREIGLLAEPMQTINPTGTYFDSPPKISVATPSFSWSSSAPYQLLDEDGNSCPSSSLSPPLSPPMSKHIDFDTGFAHDDAASERAFLVAPSRISKSLCAAVLAYDVLGLLVCFQWGSLAQRLYSVIFGRLAGIHDGLYLSSCLLYAAIVGVVTSRFVFSFFPSSAERVSAPSMLAYPTKFEESARDVLWPPSLETSNWKACSQPWARFSSLTQFVTRLTQQLDPRR